MNTLLFLIKKRLKSKVLFLLFAFGGSVSAWAQTFYVRQNGGSLNGTGSSTSPFLTIQQAHDAANPGATILVGAGVYREQVNITKNGLIFQPEVPETPSNVTINGTDLINSNWAAVSNGAYQTTPSNWKDLYSPRDVQAWGGNPDPGPTNIGYGENQLFHNGRMLEHLRWPKNTSTDVAMPTMAKVVAKTSEVSGDNGTGRTTISTTGFDGNQKWVGAKIFVNLAHNGWDGQGRVFTVTAVASNSITFDYYTSSTSVYSVGGAIPGQGSATEFYLFSPNPANMTEADITAMLGDGEWFKKDNILYVNPFGSAAPSTTEGNDAIYTKNRYFAFVGNGIASNYTVEGFNIFASSVGTYYNYTTTESPTTGCSGVKFRNLDIKYVSHTTRTADYQLGHAGWTGVVLNGQDHEISNCVIRYSSSSAISLQGNRHKCLNNQIFDTNYMLMQSGAINTGRTGLSEDLDIGYNLIANTTHSGINIYKFRNSNVNTPGIAQIHHNTIRDFCRRTGDDGAIHGFGIDFQWARFHHNYIYNTMGHDLLWDAQGIHGLYHDFGHWGPNGTGTGRIRSILDHNVITNLQTPILVNDGRDLKIFNNTLIGNGAPFPNGRYSIGNYVNESGYSGAEWIVFNNILSHPLSDNVQYAGGNTTVNAQQSNNITDATMAYVLNPSTQLFVNARFEGTDRSFSDFTLVDNATTTARVIDKGDLQLYNSSGVVNDPGQNLPDLGANEWGAKGTPETTPPTTPTSPVITNLTSRGFTLTWGASTDASGVTRYVISNPGGTLGDRTINEGTTSAYTDLPETNDAVTYSLKVIAYDVYGNASAPLEITVIKPAKTADVNYSKNSKYSCY